MKSLRIATHLPLIALLALLPYGPAQANGFYSAPPDAEINRCIAEVDDRVDFADASRVRHDVVSNERRSIGYTLDIATRLYAAGSDAVIREYRSVCVITGGSQPARLEVTKLGT